MKYFFSLIFVLSLYNYTHAQNFGGSIFSGVGISNFENQDSPGYAIPLGVNFWYRFLDNLELGLELNTTMSGYVFEDKEKQYTLPSGSKVIASGTASFSQNIIGIFAKYFFNSILFSPYLKAGFGYYSGRGKLKGDYHYNHSAILYAGTLSFDLQNSMGFSIGAGFLPYQKINQKISLEAIYHLLETGAELKDSQKEGANAFEIRIGYSFDLTKS